MDCDPQMTKKWTGLNLNFSSSSLSQFVSTDSRKFLQEICSGGGNYSDPLSKGTTNFFLTEIRYKWENLAKVMKVKELNT